MNHRYIDETSVAERYIDNRLRPQERWEFEAHLKDCDECADRVQLARLFLEQQALRPEVVSPAAPARAEKPVAPTSRPVGRYSILIDPDREPIIPISPPEIHPVGAPFAANSTLPWTVRFVAQFRPWQLLVILVIAAALLLSVPTWYFLKRG
ncbi:MAG: zf-HC2 domain-containing protein [Bryobacteraceae bacterium]